MIRHLIVRAGTDFAKWNVSDGGDLIVTFDSLNDANMVDQGTLAVLRLGQAEANVTRLQRDRNASKLELADWRVRALNAREECLALGVK